MAVNLSPVGGVAAQFFDNNGVILSGGKLYTYAAGTTTPQATYTASNGAVAWTNPIVLNSAGRVPSGGEIWLTDGLQYKFVLKDSNDVTIATYDNITGINSNFVNYTNQQELQTATAGQTVFTLTTMTYQPGTNSLSVFVDGVNQYGPGALYAYTETSDTVVTFVSGLHVGAEVKFTTSQINASSYGTAAQIAFTGFKGQTGNVQDLADDDGADWIGFEQAGTGAVAISAQDKMRQIVSVKDFGAVGDGVVDDTAAIQAAIDTSAQAIYFPTGTYIVSEALLPTSSQTFYGDGGEVSIIKAINNFAADPVTGQRNLFYSDNTAPNCTFTNLGFDCNKAGYSTPPTQNTCSSIYFVNGNDYLTITDCVFRNIYTGSHVICNADGAIITGNKFLDSGFDVVSALETNPLQINNGAKNVICANNYFDSTTDFLIGIEASCENVLVEGNILYNKYSIGSGAIGGFSTASNYVRNITIRNNIVDVSSTSGYAINFGFSGASALRKIEISSNTFYSGSASTIQLYPRAAVTTGEVRDIVIANNNFYGNASSTNIDHCILIYPYSSDQDKNPATNVVIKNNTFRNYVASALKYVNPLSLTVEGNTFYNVASNTSGNPEVPIWLAPTATILTLLNVNVSGNYAYDQNASLTGLVYIDQVSLNTISNISINNNCLTGGDTGASILQTIPYYLAGLAGGVGNSYVNNLANGSAQPDLANYVTAKYSAYGISKSDGVKAFQLAPSAAQDVCYLDFDSSYGTCFVTVLWTGMGASNTKAFVAAQRHINLNNGTPSLVTINTDSTSGASVAFSYVSGKRMKVTVTSAVAEYITGSAEIVVSGAGTNTGTSAGVTLTMI